LIPVAILSSRLCIVDTHCRATAVPGVVEERADRGALKRPGVPIGISDSKVGGAIKAPLWHANVTQRGRRTRGLRQVEKSRGGVGDA
jgi:hypothetical protein